MRLLGPLSVATSLGDIMLLVRTRVLGTALALLLVSAAPAAAINLVQNGSFEGPSGSTPTGWSVGGAAADNYLPVAIAYGQGSRYPTGAQGESVPTDTAQSLSPDTAGNYGVYFVSDEATNLSLYQNVYLTPGSYDIGFDSYETFNGAQQPHDAYLTGRIAGVTVASFDLASMSAGSWSSHTGVASITTAGFYLVSFTFNTPDYPNNPDYSVPGGPYNARDVVIDRAYVIANANGGGTVIPSSAPEPATWATMVAGFALVGRVMRRRKATWMSSFKLGKICA